VASAASAAEVVPVPPLHRASHRPGPSHPSRRGQTISQKSSPFPWKEKNHGDDSATATTATTPPPPAPSAASRAFLSSSGPPPLARYYRHRQRHRHCTRRLLLRHPRSTVISRNVGTTATYKPRSRRPVATDGRGYVRDRMTRGATTYFGDGRAADARRTINVKRIRPPA